MNNTHRSKTASVWTVLLLLAVTFALGQTVRAAAPANDNFANAIVLTGSTPTATGSTVESTLEAGEPDPAGTGGTHSVWFKWTAPAGGSTIINLGGSDYDTALGVYTGAAVNALTVVADNDDYAGFQSQVTFQAVAGTVYSILVNGYSGEQGNFKLALTQVPAPINDNFANAIDLGSVATFTTTGNTIGSTSETGEPNAPIQSIWYKWTANATRTVQLNTVSPVEPHDVSVYTGNAVNALVMVVSNDFISTSFSATSGTVYYIRLTPDDEGFGGPVTLSLPAAPANDNFANAIDLGNVTSFAVLGNTIGATHETGEVFPGNGYTIWYKWTSPLTGTVRMNDFGSGSGVSPTLRVFTGNAVNTLVAVTSTIGNGTVQVPVTTGTVYSIVLDSGTSTGPVAVNLVAGPPNDNFASAIDLGSVPAFNVMGNTLGATFETGEPMLGSAGSTIWWKWTAPATKKFKVDTNGSSVSAQAGVYTGNAVNTLVLVPTPGGIFSATAGTVYNIKVDCNSFASLGNVRLNLSGPPANDDFANAIVLSGVVEDVPGTNVNASKETGEPNHGGDAGGASVWYSWTAPSSGLFSIEHNANFNAELGVYTGTAVNALTVLTQSPANTDFSTFVATAGTVYKIGVDGLAGTTGNFTLTITSTPPNDNFANRITLSGATFSVQGTTVGATNEPFEPPFGFASVWYTWTAPSSGNFTLSTGDLDASFGVFTGSTLQTLAPVLLTSGQTVTFAATAGTVYQFSLIDAGPFTLTLVSAPPNDNFVNAIVLSGPTFDINGSNLGATNEPGEATGIGATVWYKWTAPADAHVTLLVSGVLNKQFNVFTGAAINTLTAVPGSTQDANAFSFDAKANTVYWIPVGGSQSGFRLQLFAPPANDNFASAAVITGAVVDIDGHNRSATRETGEPNHNFAANSLSVWYSWTAPAAGGTQIKLLNSTLTAPQLGVYTGTAVNALTRVNSSAVGNVTFTAVAGTVYSIAVDSAGSGNFTLELAQAPSNDNFVNAIALTGTLPITTTGNDLLATVEPGEPSHAGLGGGHSVWWSYTATDTHRLEVSTLGSSFNTRVGIYTGTAVAALTQVGANDDANGFTTTSLAQFDAVAGTTYFIAVDGNGGAIALALRPANVAITSPLSVSPSPQVAGKKVTFTIAVDAPATFHWDFGDGLSETSKNPTISHVYAIAGTYNVAVTVSLDNGFSVSSNLTITVLPGKSLGLTKATITLNFAGKPNSDSIVLNGALAFKAGDSNSGAFRLKLAGTPYDKTFTLSSGTFKSKSTTLAESIKVTAPKGGVGNAKFTLTLKGAFAATFAPLGLTSAVVSGLPVEIPIEIVFNNTSYQFSANLLYTSTGKKGTAK